MRFDHAADRADAELRLAGLLGARVVVDRGLEGGHGLLLLAQVLIHLANGELGHRSEFAKGRVLDDFLVQTDQILAAHAHRDDQQGAVTAAAAGFFSQLKLLLDGIVEARAGAVVVDELLEGVEGR